MTVGSMGMENDALGWPEATWQARFVLPPGPSGPAQLLRRSRRRSGQREAGTVEKLNPTHRSASLSGPHRPETTVGR